MAFGKSVVNVSKVTQEIKKQAEVVKKEEAKYDDLLKEMSGMKQQIEEQGKKFADALIKMDKLAAQLPKEEPKKEEAKADVQEEKK